MRTMTIENPDNEAIVDFIDLATVTIRVSGGKVAVNVKIPHGVSSSTWDEHDFEADLPDQDPDDSEDSEDSE